MTNDELDFEQYLKQFSCVQTNQLWHIKIILPANNLFTNHII